MATTPVPLFYIELNPNASETIVFIHSLLASHLEFALVTPQLADNHLLLVDTNGHSRSADVRPFTVPAAADKIAPLIRRHAHDGCAHLVGLSMGGFIALELARRYPFLVKSAFVTGAAAFQGVTRWLASHPSLIWHTLTALLSLPDVVYWAVRRRGLLLHEELYAAMQANRRWEVVRGVFGSILEVGWEEVRAVQARTLTIAGAKDDNVDATRRLGLLLREDGDERSRAVVIKEAIHTWDLQIPELFAQGVRACVEGDDLPKEFDDL